MLCAFFCVCATAAPLTAAAPGEACTPDHTGLEVGGAAETTSNEPAFTFAAPAAIPPQRQTRYRELRQGFHTLRNVPQPPWLYDDPDPDYVPHSPPYPPPPYSSDDEEQSSGDHAAVHDDRQNSDSFSGSTNDSITTSTSSIHGTMTVLRAGTAVPPPTSG
ncbi:hypothetical protein CYMTET_11320 [Cymbomonas tetramitiformis]|uniref:Uncharacterized protein n=1 Tax=Cymbomonas tetramitiformis TaxID=36881 RepID=A0AAE0GNX9_9CHLO|nr:hypothetical protein CYMTET_11320 [Cymbomonas tetramitiformis]